MSGILTVNKLRLKGNNLCMCCENENVTVTSSAASCVYTNFA